MRNIILAVMRIKDDFMNNPFLMFLYVLGSIVCVLIFSVFWGSVPNLIEEYNEISLSERTYTISFEQGENIKFEDFDFLNKYGISSITAEKSPEEKYSLSNKDETFSDIYRVTIIFRSVLSDNSHAEMIKEISEKFYKQHKISEIATPYSDITSHKQISEIVQKIINISLIYLICFIACAYLFKYVFDTNTYENTVYSIIGASKKRVMVIVLIEAVILTLGCSLIALLLNVVLKDNILSDFAGSQAAFTIWDCLIIIGSALILSLVTMIPFFVKYLKNPIIETKREL